VQGADILSKWVGEAERMLRLLFAEAERCQPSIIFFDEIDGLAPVTPACAPSPSRAALCCPTAHLSLASGFPESVLGLKCCKHVCPHCNVSHLCWRTQGVPPGRGLAAQIRSSKQDQIHNSIVSTLLALMDGLTSRGQVVVIGATNR